MPTNITLFSLYKESGFTPILVLCSSLYIVLAIPGMAMNFTLFYITVKKKNSSIFKSKTNYLIAFLCISEFVHQCGHFLFFVVTLSGQNFIPTRIAFLILFLPLVAFESGSILMNFTGIDRLLSILLPLSYRNWPNRPYLSVMLLLCLSISLSFNLRLGYLIFNGDREQPMTGYFGEIVVVPENEWTVTLNLFLYETAIALYALVAICVCCKKVQNTAAIIRLYKAVALIVLFNVGIYFLCALSATIFLPKISAESQVNAWFYNVANGLLFNLGVGSNLPILYMTSKDYKEAIRKELALIAKFLPKIRNGNNNVGPAFHSGPSVGRMLANLQNSP